MEKIFFALSGNEKLATSLSKKCNAELGNVVIRQFPDGETYVKILSEVKEKQVFLVCTLHNPDSKILPLYYLAQTIKELGAANICLIAPYLSYMRQDKHFSQGECVTAICFAKFLSSFLDEIITIDPHLHRIKSLSEIYNIKTYCLSSSFLISKWIVENIKNPILIGPDSESKQWVSHVASLENIPFLILEKTRKGDNDVIVSVPQVDKYEGFTPVLIDDIISSGRTMIETIKHLKSTKMNQPVCIAIHGIFANNSYADLLLAGAFEVITTNTIEHETNQIFTDNYISEIINNQII
ncbi:MAG: ribose-phosphate diphosphokinase [Flavobacterium sp.]